MKTIIVALLVVASVAYPNKWINSKDLSTVAVGDDASFMGAGTFVTGADDGKCVIIMEAKFSGSCEHTVTVTASTAAAILLQVDVGSFAVTGNNQLLSTTAKLISNTKSSTTTTSASFKWTAPASGTAKFNAVAFTEYGGTGSKCVQVTSTLDAATPCVTPVKTDFTGYVVDRLCWNKTTVTGNFFYFFFQLIDSNQTSKYLSYNNLSNFILFPSPSNISTTTKKIGASGTVFPAHTAPPAGCIDLTTSPEKHTMECIRDIGECLVEMFMLGQDASTKKYAKKYSFDAASTLALQQMICEENKGKDVTDVSDNVFYVFYVFLFFCFFVFFLIAKKKNLKIIIII